MFELFLSKTLWILRIESRPAGKNSFPPTPFLFARLLQRPQGGRGGGFFK